MSDIEKILEGCLGKIADQIFKVNPDDYTIVQVELKRGGKLSIKSYQASTTWTDDHATAEACVREATDRQFQVRAFIEDAKRKENEAAALRKRADDLLKGGAS